MKNTGSSGELQSLQHLLRLVEEKMGWGLSSGWTQGNFLRLSEQIQNKTGISISSSTLRRLFAQLRNDQWTMHPQIATKNALASFVGFSTWDDFVQQQKDRDPQTPERPEKNFSTAPAPSKARKTRLLLISLVVLVIAIASVVIYSGTGTQSSTKILAAFTDNDSLQVEFSFSHWPGKKDSLLVDYGDGIREWLLYDRKSFRHRYTLGDIYNIRVIETSKEVAFRRLVVGKRGWYGRVIQNDRFLPVNEQLKQNGTLHISAASAAEAGADTSKIYWTLFRCIDDYRVDGNNFMAKFRLRNSPNEGGQFCYDVNIDVLGEYSPIKLEFVQPDCIVWTDLVVAGVELDGKKVNLSSFGQDFTHYRIVTVEVRNRRFQVLLDDVPIYSYTIPDTPIGKIKQVTFSFKGRGFADWMKFYDSTGQLVYEDDFNQD